MEIPGLVFMSGKDEGLHRRRGRARVRAAPNGRGGRGRHPAGSEHARSHRGAAGPRRVLHSWLLSGRRAGAGAGVPLAHRHAGRSYPPRLPRSSPRPVSRASTARGARSGRPGAMSAMQIMLTGRMVRARAARAMGLIDELAPGPLNLPWMARKAVERKRKSKPMGGWRALAEALAETLLLAGKLRSETAKKAREEHYPAPFALIDLFERTGGDLAAHEGRGDAGLRAADDLGDVAQPAPRVQAVGDAEGAGAEGRRLQAAACARHRRGRHGRRHRRLVRCVRHGGDAAGHVRGADPQRHREARQAVRAASSGPRRCAMRPKPASLPTRRATASAAPTS